MDDSKQLVPAPAETTQVEFRPPAGPTAPAPPTPEIKTAGPITTPTPEQPGGLGSADAGSSTALGSPLSRPRPRAVARRKRNPWGWLLVLLLAVAAGAGSFYYVRSTQTNPAFQGQTTAATTRLPVSLAVSANGQVQANADLGLTFGSGGTITRLNKKPGDKVKAGEELAAIDDSDLQYAVKNAQAAFDQQQASYKKATEGASQKDLEVAQAQVDAARANLNKTVSGNFTAQDVAAANASINSAAARLAATRSGPTAADLAAANASIAAADRQLASARAKLAQTRAGGSPQDIAAANASISSAEAQLASAKAKLAKTQAGPDYATVAAAQTTYDQAVANYDRTLSSLKLAIVNAQVARDQALNNLKAAQDKYNTIYWNNRNANEQLKDNLKQADIDAETAAKRALDDAQGNYNKSDIALNDARLQLDRQTFSLQSSVENARAQLDKVRQGPSAADIAADLAGVASAQAALDNAKKTLAALTPTAAQLAADEASVTAAESSLASARKALAALTPTQSQVAADEASLASAQATLAKLRGGTPDEVAASEASLRSAEAALEDLKRGPKPNDLAIAKAQLDVAQTNLDKARATAAAAVLKSPINGTVVKADLTPGQPVTASTVVYQVVDLSVLHVDVNVGESDIARIKEGMPVAVNLDALSSRSYTGKVSFISSKSTVTNNVVGYLVTVSLDNDGTNSLLEAYQSEFNKLLQTPGGAPGGGRQGAPGGAGQGLAAPGGNFQLPRGASAQIAAQTGICGYSLASLFNRSGETQSPKAGMTANVTFCLQLKGGVLSVPNRAIKSKTENGQRITYVQVLVDRETNRIEDRPVLTGLAGDTYTEITGGNLKENDQIVLSATPTNTGNRATTNAPVPGGPGGGGNVIIR